MLFLIIINTLFTGDPNNGNQNLGITAMQTLFLRFHNYIAFKLSSLNPFWSDEIIYQESRRIVIATIQRIAYEDFLPIIIGNYLVLYPLVIGIQDQECSLSLKCIYNLKKNF